MKRFISLIASFFFAMGSLFSQVKVSDKKPLLSYHISFADYQFPKTPFKGNDWYLPGNKSIGFGFEYVLSLKKQVDFAGGFTGTFANFPVNFVKDDSIGQAKFSSQFDALVRIKALKNSSVLNPFLAAGFGIGSFPGKWAAYAPLGGGLLIRFKEGAWLTLQAQWRLHLTGGINNDYLIYNIGFAQTTGRKKKKTDVPEEPTLPILPDKDQDGFADDLDECMDLAGNVKGCPDTDGDGIADKDDKCPDTKGTLGGCPDRDNDLIADQEDQCPDEKGTVRGCPDTDNDGIADHEDACKDVSGLAKYKGCPIPDSDHDGFNDEEDKCPDLSGDSAHQGCPEVKAEIKEKVSFAAQKILFHFASDVLLASSYKALNEVTALLKEHPELKLRIEAHADTRGTKERNKMWSERRAKAVADYFIKQGIDPNRISYEGFGDAQPVADNKTEKGRKQNRRVVMTMSY